MSAEGKKLNHEGEERAARESSTLQLPLRRLGGREREGARERERRAGERKTFLLPPLLATEAISVVRRREEREERGREGGEIFLLLPVKRAYARMQERAREGGRREEESLPLSRSSLSLSLSRPPSLSRLSAAAATEESSSLLLLSLLPRDLIFFPRLTCGGQVASVPVSLRRGLHVDAHWTKILPCQQLG